MDGGDGYSVVILAAGNSSRLGEPKQLLQYNGKTLIRNVVEAATSAVSYPVVVVTGANSESISLEINTSSALAIHNRNWQEGMSSSIHRGITELQKINPHLQGVIISVSDQPFINSELFLALIETSEATGKGIVASFYDDTFGTPVLFEKKYFDSLLGLKGAEGAKKLIKQFAGDVASIPFPMGGIDIDTLEDYRKLTGL
jgi:molybdenum cofactor cytidylyltransferase